VEGLGAPVYKLWEAQTAGQWRGLLIFLLDRPANSRQNRQTSGAEQDLNDFRMIPAEGRIVITLLCACSIAPVVELLQRSQLSAKVERSPRKADRTDRLNDRSELMTKDNMKSFPDSI